MVCDVPHLYQFIPIQAIINIDCSEDSAQSYDVLQS